ncbi:hypothetical protein BpHYR1_001949 [Brachionus plicatilis]|uniref:Uncharacterized protein n=1 Tax=Brachionus plicatilis TaxID=10195 RepID=A0A3M7PEB2_BRAPC|nr:hypothetical protein BpHYR1_001949 [Brachionus plicatilis]
MMKQNFQLIYINSDEFIHKAKRGGQKKSQKALTRDSLYLLFSSGRHHSEGRFLKGVGLNKTRPDKTHKLSQRDYVFMVTENDAGDDLFAYS